MIRGKLFVMRTLSLVAVLLVLSSCVTLRPPSTETIERTPARLARGTYLATALADCVGCHSPRDWSYALGRVTPGTEGSGGEAYDARMKFPGSIVPSNLTSDAETGLGTASDGALLRALREGIGVDGRVLFPFMPYPLFRQLDDEDARSLVVWIRSLAPVKQARPPTHIAFPISLFIRGVPKPVDGPVHAPNPNDSRAFGRYLTTIAGCKECHSPVARGQVIEARAFGGGRTLTMPTFTVVTPNLTSAPGTFTSKATREEFIARFKSFETFDPNTRAEPGVNSLMPWAAYAHLTEADLGAIYDYLRSLSAIVDAH